MAPRPPRAGRADALNPRQDQLSRKLLGTAHAPPDGAALLQHVRRGLLQTHVRDGTDVPAKGGERLRDVKLGPQRGPELDVRTGGFGDGTQADAGAFDGNVDEGAAEFTCVDVGAAVLVFGAGEVETGLEGGGAASGDEGRDGEAGAQMNRALAKPRKADIELIRSETSERTLPNSSNSQSAA